jgi:hypothetical protein
VLCQPLWLFCGIQIQLDPEEQKLKYRV